MGSSVCFVVSDLLGLVTNSGIGTATSYGAMVLASAGYDVTLVHTRPGTSIESHWRARYREAGVEVEAVNPQVVAPAHISGSYWAYDHLRDRHFDTIVFQDWLALGWASMQAKHAGLAFEDTQLVHIVHGPDAWLHEANQQTAVDVDDVALAHAGRRSAELADTIVGPSRYLIDWMAGVGWCLPERRFVVPYFTEAQARSVLGEPVPTALAASAGPAPLREIAFFGRLERRKGVKVFTDALNLLDPSSLAGITVSFLGREATFTRHDVLGMLDGPVRDAVAGVEFHTGLDNLAACRHLGRPGTVAVVASLVDNSPNTIYECIERGIPFLATNTGGTPELLHEDDRQRCLVPPRSAPMAAALASLIASGHTFAPARPAFDAETSLRLWEDILGWRPPARLEVREQPLVTAVLTHHERPELVTTAVEALDAQDYDNLEIVIVDDGSRDAASHQVLQRIEEQSWRHDLRVLRQDNRYLGAARNTGAAAGKGDLLAFVDDDDYPVPRFVSTLVRATQATGADAVTCAMTSFNKPIGAPAEADSRGTWVFAGGPIHLAAVQNCIGGAPALIRRSALEAIGGYHERHGVGFEDWHLYVRLLFAGYTVVAIPEPIYWYRLQPSSMRSTMSDYQSANLILEEFRRVLPPALRGLPDLAYGQAAVSGERRREFHDELDVRDRVLWLAEERLKRLQLVEAQPPSSRTSVGPIDGNRRDLVQEPESTPQVDAFLQKLAAGRDGLRRLADRLSGPRDRST